MEGKRASAIVALCMLILLSGQQQVSGQQQLIVKERFCVCYKYCYNQCRSTHLRRWICLPKCVTDCTIACAIVCPVINKKVAALTSAADCSKICLISICGSATTDTSGAAACVDDCTKNQSQYAKHL